MDAGLVEKGIRRERWGFLAYTRVQGKLIRRSFPKDATLDEMRAWRARAREIAKWDRLGRTRRIPRLTRNIDSWCYLYFIRSGDLVKIGRAVDPVSRLDDLQTGSSARLTLLAAVPAHANLEKVVHEHFGDCHTASGEWFRLTPELADFIQRVRDGENPVALVWKSLA